MSLFRVETSDNPEKMHNHAIARLLSLRAFVEALQVELNRIFYCSLNNVCFCLLLREGKLAAGTRTGPFVVQQWLPAFIIGQGDNL